VLRGLDLFCGAGGSSAGARAAGFEMVAAIDKCPIATATYKANFPRAETITSLLEEVDVARLKQRLGDIDLLLASPECTNHTCARGSAPRDEASRATAMHVIAYARAFSPRWLVLENVVHMRPWSRYEELKNELRLLGYHLAEHVLNASHFGVPQNRRRLFVVGDRECPPNAEINRRPGPRPSAKSILDPDGMWETSPLFRQSRAEATLVRARRAFEALGPDSSFLLVYYGTDGGGGWQPLSRPLRTVTTIDRFALVRSGADGPEMRMLQVPELKRAMGLEDSFLLPVGTRRDRIRLLGNGVCAPVVTAVLRSLLGATD